MSDPTLVPVRAPDGSIGTVPKDQLSQAIDAGAEVVSDAELHHAKVRATRGGAIDQAKAFGAGVARGATLGLSDVAADAGPQGEQNLQELGELQEANPTTSTVGEVTGAIAPALLSGGATAPESLAAEGGSLARVASTIPRGVTALGERAGAAFGGEGIAGKALQFGVQGATEGALYGAGNAVSEAALGDDHELTAEKLMAGMKHGALMGGVAGGVLGAAGGLASREAPEQIAQAFEPGAAEGEAKGLRGALNDFAETKAFKSAGPTIADERTVEKFVAGGKNKVGRDMLDYLPDAMGKPLATASVDEIAAGAQAVKEKAGAQIGALIDEADQAGIKAAAEGTGKAHAPLLDGQTLTKRIMDEVYNPLANKVGYEAAAKSVGTYVENLAAKLDAGPLTFEKLQGIRQDLDGLVHRASGAAGNPAINVPIAVEELRAVRRVMENYLVEVGDKASTEMGGSWAARYKAAKGLYQSMGHVERMAGNQVLRAERNATFGLRDTISAAGALAAGHPIAGVVTAFGSKVLRERGNQILGDLANRVAKLGAVERVTQRVDASLTTGVKKFLSSKSSDLPHRIPASVAVLGQRRAETGEAAYNRKVDEVRSVATDNRAAANNFGKSVGDLHAYAPKTTGALARKAQQASAFLLSKLPVGHDLDPNSVTPQLEKPQVSDSERRKWLRYYAAVNDPTSVVEDLAHGRLTPEGAEALKAVYPKLYTQVQQSVLDGLAQAKTKLPMQKRVQLGLLLDIPTDATMTPDFLRAIQAASAAGEKEKPGGPAPKPRGSGKPLSLTKNIQTSFDHVEAGES